EQFRAALSEETFKKCEKCDANRICLCKDQPDP
ncbi:unnamed protein product, partial [marine sediment metagenome]